MGEFLHVYLSSDCEKTSKLKLSFTFNIISFLIEKRKKSLIKNVTRYSSANDVNKKV